MTDHTDSHTDEGSVPDPRELQRASRAAMKELLQPVARTLLVSRVLAALSAVLAIAPYVALVHLGGLLLSAATSSTAPDQGAVMTTVYVLVGTFGARVALYFLALAVSHFADARLGDIIRGRLISSLGEAPLAWFSSTNSGRVRKAVQDDSHTLHTLVAHAPVENTSALIMPLALFAYAFVVDWRLGLLTIATFPIYAGLQAWGLRDMNTKTAEMDARLTKVSSTMVEFVSGITVVKAFGVVGKAHRNYQQAANEFSRFYLNWTVPLLRASSLSLAVVAPSVLLAVMFGGGTLMVHAGWVSAVDVLACALIALVLPASIEVLSSGQWAYQLASGSALRITEVLNTPRLPRPTSPAVPSVQDVVFEDVRYSYGEILAVDGVSLVLQQGTTTALIGPSGSGKSTLATLVARFADPDQGRVLIGGVDVRQIPTADLYRQVAFVLQDPQLLRISIADNIRLGRPEATDEQVRTAARQAQIDEYIMTLPDGYDTVIDRDTGLSGGQAQRVAIARALLVDAPILLLDEATAFTDPESEAEIQQALENLALGKTVLVIAHRPASIQDADQIVVLERGRVIAKGTHQQLQGQRDYESLWQMTGQGQTGGTK